MRQPIRSLYANIIVKTLANQIRKTPENSRRQKTFEKVYNENHVNAKCQ